MNPGAREEILRRIEIAGSNVAAAELTPRHYRSAMGAGSVELFVGRLIDYRAAVHRVTLEDLSSEVGECLRRQGASRVIVPEGLATEWLSGTSATVTGDHPRLSASELDDVDGVITSCSVAIAETGTIVLTHGAGQGRRALTLVPDYHLVVVFEDQIVSGVPDAVATLDATAPMTWVSGPSATSDIELRRVEGVHGPRTLEVLVVGGLRSDGLATHVSIDPVQA